MARRRFNPKPPKVVPGAAAAADARAAAAASRVASINLQAMTGRSDIHQGSRVIIGSGLGAGELATVESVIGGVIPAAVVRTDGGLARRVRTIDLTPAPPASEPPRPQPAASATPEPGAAASAAPSPAQSEPAARPAPPASAPAASAPGASAPAAPTPAAPKPAAPEPPAPERPSS